MKKYIISCITLCFFIKGLAQVTAVNAGLPSAYKENVHSIKKEERIELDIRSAGKAYYKVHRTLTILDERGKDEIDFVEFTDQFVSLEDVNIQVFDVAGKLLNKYSKKDMNRQLAGDGLVPDGKVYFSRIIVPGYPITIQTDYELKFNGIISYPAYEIQRPDQSIENATFIARVPTDIDLRYKLKNTVNNPAVNTDGKVKTYTWSFKSLPALEEEEGSVSRESRYPRIILAPNKFEMDGHEGDMTSWQNFGKWYADLAKGSNDLSPERQGFFQSLVKGAANDQEKIRIIYSYLQHNCRYVSIQLGIGGFKPFEASFVDTKKYGDCKALSNYTQACLQAVGIRSYQALINAEYNREPVDPGFPNNSFNHVIICVPMSKDSVWLECTSNTNEFGVLGSFTENRNALLITEDGGKLVPTPRSRAADNLFVCSSSVKLNEDGSGTANIKLNSTGEYKQEFIHYMTNEKKDDQKKFLVYYLGFTQPDEFELKYNKDDPHGETNLNMSIEKIPSFSTPNKMFMNPRIYKIWSASLPKTENRTQDFYFEQPFIKTDTTRYRIPEGFGIETLPKPKNLRFEYGSFVSDYRFDETKKEIISTARLELDEFKIPARKYAAAQRFFNDVLEEYSEKIVIKRL